MIDLHQLFYYLGTTHGELVKHSVELILFTFVTYMIISEYTKEHRQDLKYMIFAFGALSIERLITTLVLANVVFGTLGENFLKVYYPVVGNFLELAAIILLANAFVFPSIRQKAMRVFKKNVMIQISGLIVLFAIAQTNWIFSLSDYWNHWSNSLFSILKVVFIISIILFLSIKTKIGYRYRHSTIIAFMVFLVAPLLQVINVLFYSSLNAKLVVASQPFPFIAVAFFARVIYLRLVDKVFLRDKLKISEEKYRHEKELGKMRDKFVSTVSHELRTPLTSIGLYTSLFKEGKFGKINAKQKEAISVIKTESMRLSGLINEILDLAKLEERKIKLNISDFDVYLFFRSNIYYPLAKKKGLRIVNKLNSKFVIQVDSEKFTRVLINLISNAIKYTDKGEIILSAKKSRRNYEITIADTGRGISGEELKKIFDKFYQVEHYMTRKERGSGLGLAIANEIVKLHKGRIDVKSSVGKGSSFTIILPKNL